MSYDRPVLELDPTVMPRVGRFYVQGFQDLKALSVLLPNGQGGTKGSVAIFDAAYKFLACEP